LADAGARVIKIERPGGDFARGYDAVARGQSSYFVWLNRGKESLVLDLAQPADRARLAALLGRADVLIQNLKPGAMARLGFDPGELRKTRPELITCSISGYGAGPLADRKAYDLLIQAEAGLASITGGPEAPARVGISIVDIATGATAHAAILEALIARGITGQGRQIDISMFDVIADWMAVPLLQHLGGKPPGRVGLSHPSIAPYGAFTSGDGAVFLISIQSDREWAAFCRDFLDQPGMADDPRFARNVARVANRAETDARVATGFACRNGAETIAALTAADIAFASVNDMAGLAAHPHLRMTEVDTPAGRVRVPAPAVIVDGLDCTPGPVPGLGQHGAGLAR
jgi:crotonobetainyl-CoA:carnitine CoA-transferase CaiB-like acyl-CoA transferase